MPPIVYDYRRRKGHRWAWAVVLALLILAAGWWLYSHPGFLHMSTGVGYDSIEDLAKHPEAYVGRRIRLRGELNYVFFNCWTGSRQVSGSWGLFDEQGYFVPIMPPAEQRALYRGDTYEVVGVVKRYQCENYKRPLYVVEVEEMRRV